ncbi:hypothetical protein A3B45_00235 [Candidatus Daviesbacteria bacterium RIFCSPLOWO2_01_FULL_39_12]|uniref:Polysaccharide biosynthesis protein C-terminal domain-containing protein n=1 Tax=Candidatus Daviesbacteria bacterium RIFCSPLOWO2_01_FULL_39_12 TaxID=1797785 RepID=A0A1F5KP04_9BACT|nr:MAG: hypothetical protein A3B45_00235 [Candidatus Daviesbacteria bacterium RIFCSPLOWO2_01_FULL_39_12]
MFRKILNTATFRQSQITILGTLINGGLGALFYILLARFLGPANFGLLTIALTTLVLIADIADIGTNTGLVRFVSANLVNNKEKAYKFLKLALEVKLITSVISFLAIFLLAPFLATYVFHKVELTILLKFSALGIGGALLFSFATSALQAYQKYFLWSAINIFTNAIRFVGILILGYLVILNIENSLILYISLPFFGFFITLFILPTKKIIQSRDEFNLAKELFKYNIPVAIFTIIAAVSARLDTYLTAVLLSTKDIGIYGAANQLVQVMPQLVSALGLVAAPKFSSFQNNSQMLTYFRKFQLFVLGLCILGILTIPISIYLIPVLFGQAYQEAVTPFIFLFIAMLVFLFSIPVHNSVIFYFSRPDVFIWVAIGHLAIIGGLGYIMISNYGVVGASITVLVGTIFNFLYPLIWMVIKLKR